MVNSNALTAAFFTLRIRNVHLWSATWWCQHLLMLLLLLTALERQRRVHQTPRRTMTFLELKPRAPPRVHSWLLLVEILERRVMQQLRDPALQQLLMASVEDPAADGHAKYWPAKCCELTSSCQFLAHNQTHCAAQQGLHAAGSHQSKYVYLGLANSNGLSVSQHRCQPW